jgi:hypothetical protein
VGKGYAAEWRAALLDGKRWMTVDALLVGGTTAALLSGIEGDEGWYYRCASGWKRWTKVALFAGRGLSC